jgi:hypothetical protein
MSDGAGQGWVAQYPTLDQLLVEMESPGGSATLARWRAAVARVGPREGPAVAAAFDGAVYLLEEIRRLRGLKKKTDSGRNGGGVGSRS